MNKLLWQTHRNRLALGGLGRFAREWAVVNGRYCQRIEELILSLGRDYRQRGSSSRLHLRLVNNRIQLVMYLSFRNNLHEKIMLWEVGLLYVPCSEFIVAVIVLNQEGVGLIKRSRIGEGKVGSDEVFKRLYLRRLGNLQRSRNICVNCSEKWMSGERKEEAWPYTFPSFMWNKTETSLTSTPSLITHLHIPSHSNPRLVLCNFSRMQSLVDLEEYGMVHQHSFIYECPDQGSVCTNFPYIYLCPY